MDDDSQAKAYANADFEEPHSNFIKLFQHIFGCVVASGCVLDLGCGPGDITSRFARAYPNCTVHGVDGSAPMISHGKRIFMEASDIKDRVRLLQGVLPGAVLLQEKYDVIISNSLLHHLRDPLVLWESVWKYAVSGATVFVMDLLRPATCDEARQLVETYTANEPEVLKRDFYNSLLAAFELQEVVVQLKEARLDHLSVEVVSDRHFIVTGHMP